MSKKGITTVLRFGGIAEVRGKLIAALLALGDKIGFDGSSMWLAHTANSDVVDPVVATFEDQDHPTYKGGSWFWVLLAWIIDGFIAIAGKLGIVLENPLGDFITTHRYAVLDSKQRRLLEKVCELEGVKALSPKNGCEQEACLLPDDNRTVPQTALVPGMAYCRPHGRGYSTLERWFQRALSIGLRPAGTNVEVSRKPHQIELQLEYSDPLALADRWVTAQWIGMEEATRDGYRMSFDPKILKGENGAGLHASLSTKDTVSQTTVEAGQLALSRLSYKVFRGMLHIIRVLHPENTGRRLSLAGGYETAGLTMIREIVATLKPSPTHDELLPLLTKAMDPYGFDAKDQAVKAFLDHVISEPMGEPTDEEVLAFAAKLVGGRGMPIRIPKGVWEAGKGYIEVRIIGANDDLHTCLAVILLCAAGLYDHPLMQELREMADEMWGNIPN